MTPEERLVRSLPGLRALIDSLSSQGPSEACELIRLDRLVRRYPAAARMSLRQVEPTLAERPAPPGWAAVRDVGGLPPWRWAGGAVCVATRDEDQLRYLGVALEHFDRMTAEQLHAYLRG